MKSKVNSLEAIRRSYWDACRYNRRRGYLPKLPRSTCVQTRPFCDTILLCCSNLLVPEVWCERKSGTRIGITGGRGESPVPAYWMASRCSLLLLKRLHRMTAIRIIRGYRTVSYALASVLEASPPF